MKYVGDKWKFHRTLLSPLFTSAKLKILSDPLHRLSEEHISFLNEEVKLKGGRMKIELEK
jgi:hypothetical protein